MIRVRFAPAPTGFLHIGGLRTALYNDLFARRHGGTLILRIEDTDRTRYVEGAVENLLRTLAWAGIEPDEGPYLDNGGQVAEKGDCGPYFQSNRLKTYLTHVEQLLESGHAYRCFCSTERLDQVRERQQAAGLPMMYDRHCREHLGPAEMEAALKEGKPHVIRLKVPSSGQITVEDEIRGAVTFASDLIDDQVLLKSDGFPTYHLANVIDDHLMGVTHVIRGEEWLPSTPKHLLLYRAFGWTPPRFAHLPLLLNPDHSKLSKRQGDVAVEDYRNKGYLPAAIINFIALLGFNPKADQEVYTKDELIRLFDLNRVNKAGAVFNREKLDWLNREYMKQLPDQELGLLAQPYFEKLPGFRTDDRFIRAVHLERSRASLLTELAEGSTFYFVEDFPLDRQMLPWKKSTPELALACLIGLRQFLADVEAEVFDDQEKLNGRLLAFVAERGWTNADALWPMRVALTGRQASPSPSEVAWAVGRERTLSRLDRAIAALS